MIPLEQGSVFRRNAFWRVLEGAIVSIPLEQGSVFRRRAMVEILR